MSYYIDSITILDGGVTITEASLDALNVKLDGVYPAGWNPMFTAYDLSHLLGFFPWCGEGSDADTLVDVVLPAFDGAADFLICYAGGDSYLGVRLRDRVARKHYVRTSLTEEL